MIKNNKLLIDRDCPMCAIYGKGFMQMGLIDGQTLMHYQTANDQYACHIDMERAKSEIALHDAAAKETLYGIDALIKIVSHRLPWLQSLLMAALPHALLLRIYRFISYNRKVIYPTTHNPNGHDCTPAFSAKYRVLYIMAVALFTGLVLNKFSFEICMALGLPYHWMREYIVCFGQIGWQLAAILMVAPANRWNYLGNMSTVSAIGGLLLLPVLALHAFFPLPPFLLIGLFAAVVSTMFLEHIRRCRLLDIPLTMTGSWVLYRLVVLAAIVVGQLL